jgi:hypothetical protein
VCVCYVSDHQGVCTFRITKGRYFGSVLGWCRVGVGVGCIVTFVDLKADVMC